MNRRDYRILIDALVDARRPYSDDTDIHVAQRLAVDSVVNELCHHLALDNANFNRDKFIASFTARV